jgi:hypothetical protein
VDTAEVYCPPMKRNSPVVFTNARESLWRSIKLHGAALTLRKLSMLRKRVQMRCALCVCKSCCERCFADRYIQGLLYYFVRILHRLS